jgi:hypothetical protein
LHLHGVIGKANSIIINLAAVLTVSLSNADPKVGV